jgi:hypothetical protein
VRSGEASFYYYFYYYYFSYYFSGVNSFFATAIFTTHIQRGVRAEEGGRSLTRSRLSKARKLASSKASKAGSEVLRIK